MKSKVLNLAMILVAIVATGHVEANAQTSGGNATRVVAPNLMESLPASDAVAHIKVKRLLNEAMPKILANNPAKLAEATDTIERFKTRTGLDPRKFDHIAVGIRYTFPREGVTKLETVALASGTFSAGGMVAAGRIASNGKYREEKHQGKTIYIFSLDENIRLFGLFNLSIGELAAVALGPDILALGTPNNVRGAIDAYGGNTANAELIALASRDPNAIIGFGSNVTPQLVNNLDLGNAPITTELAAVRQAYGSVGTTEKDLQLFIAARATDAAAAKNLSDTVEGISQLGSFFVGRLSGARGVLARSALSNLKIVTQENELHIRTAVAQADVGPLMGN